MCKVSESAYKHFRQEKHGIRACCNLLSPQEIHEKTQDIDLLEYFLSRKDTITCDVDKLTETLT
jgi:hypothetical protein